MSVVCRNFVVNICVVHVGVYGSLPGDSLCKIWQASVGSTLLQCRLTHTCDSLMLARACQLTWGFPASAGKLKAGVVYSIRG